MKISVLIRNLNESAALQQTLAALQKQATGFEYEVLLVDNESDDDSVAVAEAMGCRVITLQRGAFTFGHALNYGIAHCKGEIIVILSAHILLLNEFFLQNIPAYFEQQKVAGLRFIQADVPAKLAQAVAGNPSVLTYDTAPGFAEDNWNNLLVNHCAAIRKAVWEQVRFDEQVFASEDKIWSLEVLKKGYSIIYNVPGFYVYSKPFSRDVKIKRAVIEEAAKELITGKASTFSSGAYGKKITSGIRRIISELRVHNSIANGLKKYRKK